MKLTINKTKLNSALQNVIKALSPRANMPILEGIHIVAENKEIKLTCSDSTLFIQSTVEADIEKEGRCVVNAKLFCDIVRHMSSDDINIEINDKNQMIIRSGKNRSSIIAMNDLSYPSMIKKYTEQGIHINQNTLKNMLNHVIFAIAQGEVRETLNGGLLEIDKNEIRMVGLDGFKMSLQKNNGNYVLPNNETISCIVPCKVLNQLCALLEDKEENITMHLDNNHIMFVMGDTTLLSSLYSGKYVNYKALLPNSWQTYINVRKQDLLSAVERAGLVASSLSSNVIKLDIKESSLIITSHTDIGDVYEEIDIELDGQEQVIAFNGKYLSEILKNIDTDFVIINITSITSPVLFMPKDEENSKYLLMSVKL